MIRFMSLASGSTGNCYYLEHNGAGLLIDAGIPLYDIKSALEGQRISLVEQVRAILVTHNHADHTRTVGLLSNHYGLPVYATALVHKEMTRNRRRERIAPECIYTLEHEQVVELNGLRITPFEVPHDSADNVGYFIEKEGFALTLLTDVGHVTPRIEYYARQAQHLILEANYDKQMLFTGSYPAFLKRRVSGPLGHLSNDESVEFLCRIWTPQLRNVWLCHLSKENNHPDLCLRAFDQRLFYEGIRIGKDLYLEPLKRNQPSPIYLLEP